MPAAAPADTLAAARGLLAELIAMPTVSDSGNLALIGRVRALLEPLGARLRLTPSACGTKANLFATIGPEVAGGVVLSGHTDVVPVEGQPWTLPPFAATERAGRIHGRGAADMKGFLACVLAMAPRFAALPLARPVHIAMSHDEEVGCLGAPRMLADLAGLPRPAAAIIGEPTEMQVIAAHKGMCEYTTRLAGLSGHASAPARGVSAVEHGLALAAGLLALRPVLAARAPAGSPFDPPGTTLQVGRIAGGTSRNVIAEAAEFEWEVRPVHPADLALVRERLAALVAERLALMRAVHAAATIETETVGEVPGLAPDPGSPAVALALGLTGRNSTGAVPFNTEAGLFQQAGIPAVVCGPGRIAEAHRPDEWIALDQIAECLGFLDRLGARLAG